jgi:hypothetical protein
VRDLSQKVIVHVIKITLVTHIIKKGDKMKIKTMFTLGAAALLTVACGTNSQTSSMQSDSGIQDGEIRLGMGKVAAYSLDEKDSKMVLAFTGEAAKIIYETLSKSDNKNPNGAFNCLLGQANTYNCSTVLTANGELRQQNAEEEPSSIDLDKVKKGDSVVLDRDLSGTVLAVSFQGEPARAAYNLLANTSLTSGGSTAGDVLTKGALSCRSLSVEDAVCRFDLQDSGMVSAPDLNN